VSKTAFFNLVHDIVYCICVINVQVGLLFVLPLVVRTQDLYRPCQLSAACSW